MASSSATAMLAAGIAALVVLSLSVPHVAAARALGVVEWPCCRQYDAPPTFAALADIEAQEERPRGPPVDPLKPYQAPPPPHVKAPVPAAQPPRPRGPPVDPLQPYLAPPPPVKVAPVAPVPSARPPRPSYRGPPVDPWQLHLAPPPPVKVPVAPVPAVQPPSPIRVPYAPFPTQLEAAADSETTDNAEPEWPCCRQYDAPPTV